MITNPSDFDPEDRRRASDKSKTQPQKDPKAQSGKKEVIKLQEEVEKIGRLEIQGEE